MWNPSRCSRLLAGVVPVFLSALTVGASLPAQAQRPPGPPVPRPLLPGGRPPAAANAGWQSLSIEPSTDRLGADYRIFDLQVADVEPCRRACADDPRCAAYTYADPGLVSPQPRCFLKKSAPGPAPKAGCTSGAKQEAAAPLAAGALSIEPATDRPGADYRVFDLATPEVELCRSACAEDPGCAAYTYADPGLVGPQPRCFLKKSAPGPAPKAGCTSGQKPPAARPLSIEPSVDRLGADYRIFDLAAPNVEPCRRACTEDPRCAAYTYADPGLVSPQPRCFLKKSAPPARPKAGCTSGARLGQPTTPSPPLPIGTF